MTRAILAALAALCLSACIPGLQLGGVQAPAPLAQTHYDEQALNLAWETFDTVLTSVDALVESGHLVRNSPRALQVRRYLIQARSALNAATAAARAGNTTDYGTALAQAREAYTNVRGIISGETGASR